MEKRLVEIERKFLVVGEFKDKAYACSHIEQGYISSGNGRTVRVRIRDDKGFLTIKGPSDEAGLARFEWEKEIPVDEARQLMNICMPGRIIKDRYLVHNGKHTIEVDEFFGENQGLVMAEIELESEDEEYLRPDFLGKEVTGDRKYYNSHLMRAPYTLWPQLGLQ
ncbi:MAG: CYTH domain-containing protein [Bacteroidales bacterium]|nr:CYTH domain-containing protein [Bacteroidales bacterium]